MDHLALLLALHAFNAVAAAVSVVNDFAIWEHELNPGKS